MRWWNNLCYDVFDDNFGEVLAMAVFTTVAFATFFLEDDNFVALNEALFYFANNLCAFDCGSTHFYGAVNVGKEYAVEFYAFAFFYILTKVVHIQELVFFGLELLSLDFYDYKHVIDNNSLTR